MVLPGGARGSARPRAADVPHDGRPPLRRFTRWLLATLALALVVVIAFGVHRYTAQPPAIDLVAAYERLDKEHREGRTPGGPAWDELVGLFTEYDALRGEIVATHLPPVNPDWLYIPVAYQKSEGVFRTDVARALLELYVASDLPARLTALRDADEASPPPFVVDGAFELIYKPYQHLSSLRWRLAAPELVRAQRAMRSNDHDSALESFENAIWLGRVAGDVAFWGGLNEEYSILEDLHDVLRTEINNGNVSADVARGLLTLYADRYASEQTRIRRAIEGDRLIVREVLRRTYEEGQLPYEVEFPIETPRILWISHRKAASMIDHDAERTAALVEGAATERRPIEFTSDRYEWGVPPAPVSHVSLPHRGFTRQIWSDGAHSGMVMLALAIEVFREEHGRVPETLSELVTTRIIEGLPEDPFARDGAFVYAVDRDAPLGYRLHSVGRDHHDDFGRVEEFSRGWDTRAMNADVVFTPIPVWPDE